MLNREAVKNRINALVKEYENEGIGTNLGDAMAEILRTIGNHNMKKLSYEELLKCDGIPIWAESTDKWLEVDDNCEHIGKWIIPWIYNEHFANMQDLLPWDMSKENYNKYWMCYERIL